MLSMGFPGGSVVKNPPANSGDMGWEDPLEKEMATHSSIIAWRTTWTEEPGGLQSMGVTQSWTDRDWALTYNQDHPHPLHPWIF